MNIVILSHNPEQQREFSITDFPDDAHPKHVQIGHYLNRFFMIIVDSKQNLHVLESFETNN
jgi:hypothetical protein